MQHLELRTVRRRADHWVQRFAVGEVRHRLAQTLAVDEVRERAAVQVEVDADHRAAIVEGRAVRLTLAVMPQGSFVRQAPTLRVMTHKVDKLVVVCMEEGFLRAHTHHHRGTQGGLEEADLPVMFAIHETLTASDS